MVRDERDRPPDEAPQPSATSVGLQPGEVANGRPPRWRWILVVAGATALDLLARFGAPFDFARVMHIEAVLFPVTTVVLGALLRFEPRSSGRPRAARLGVVWLFALGSLRPLLWTLGLPLLWANLAPLIAVLAGVLIWVVRRRPRALDDSSRGAA